jgi:hypothetical protein
LHNIKHSFPKIYFPTVNVHAAERTFEKPNNHFFERNPTPAIGYPKKHGFPNGCLKFNSSRRNLEVFNPAKKSAVSLVVMYDFGNSHIQVIRQKGTGRIYQSHCTKSSQPAEIVSLQSTPALPSCQKYFYASAGAAILTTAV